MPYSLSDYHFLEDGELNRLWYEENDPRARDAFMQRWWLGGDPVAGKDLLSHYHTPFMHRCYERGILAEDHMAKVFRDAVSALVKDYPADPIPKFEDVWLPFVDRAIDGHAPALGASTAAARDGQKAKLEAALASGGAPAAHLREWLATGAAERSAEDFESLLEFTKKVLVALDGDAARNHPLVRTPEPEPSKLDESVAVPHFGAKPLFQFAFQGGTLTKRENQHIEWCQPCRQRCLGALLFLRRMRDVLGGTPPALPEISPEFDQILQSESPGIPAPDAGRKAKGGKSGGGAAKLIAAVVVAVAVIVALVLFLKR